MTTIEDQPPPKNDEAQPAAWDTARRRLRELVDEKRLASGDLGRLDPLMAERDHVGQERYGVRLRAHNGRNALVDAAQEALDLVAYLAQSYDETPDHQRRVPRMLLDKAIILAVDVVGEVQR